MALRNHLYIAWATTLQRAWPIDLRQLPPHLIPLGGGLSKELDEYSVARAP